MSEDRDLEEDSLMDIWATNYEQQCLQQIESEPDYEAQLQSERDLANQKVWFMFQNTATSIAQLYKDRLQGVSLWLPFQTAAGTVTALYKESSDAVRRVGDLGMQSGYQRRTKELLNWARKRRRHIRREDLIAYLAGKPLPPSRAHHRVSPRPRMLLDCSGLMHPGSNPDSHQSGAVGIDDNLHTFREALALSGAARRRSSPHHVSTELSAFISSEFARHCKRPAPSSSPHDVNMDSPTHKRSRFM